MRTNNLLERRSVSVHSMIRQPQCSAAASPRVTECLAFLVTTLNKLAKRLTMRRFPSCLVIT